ncbi:MAG: signal recognition particle protein [Chloroflexi bacterium]|jgi:signal recognition particle subunit SRP54|nr:signal recognition particle protein [Chloroflexota bacterium]
MFENLTGRLNEVFDKLRRRGKLSERDVDDAMREVRLALLEADVHYKVAKEFIARVRERAVGHEVSRALNPGQQIVKIVNEELIATLGEPAPLDLRGPKPRTIMLVGLQGAGKTTAAGKLARILRGQGERVLMVAGDPYRPAAVQQLQTLGERLGIEVFAQPNVAPPELAKRAHDKAQKGGFGVVILDTAGRSQLDDTLMTELQAITEKVELTEVLLVVDAMIGQEAVNIAQGFREAVPLSGLILTKMDGDARGGAAISIRSVTGVPIKFLGVGEGLDALEVYDPSRLSSRILGMGDVIGLIEKAEAAFDTDTAEAQAKKLMSGEFTLEDFGDQLKQVRKMGPIGQLLDMFPGSMGQMAKSVDPQDAEQQLKRTEAILSSMTVVERRKPKLLNASRKRRIALGSGTQVQDVNQLLKQYREAQRMMKTLRKSGMRGLSGLFG